MRPHSASCHGRFPVDLSAGALVIKAWTPAAGVNESARRWTSARKAALGGEPSRRNRHKATPRQRAAD